VIVDSLRPEPTPELIERARNGDEKAFAELVRPYRIRLFTLLLRELQHREDAEDAMQDLLFHAWNGLHGYTERGRFTAWLFTIAYRTVASERRAANRSKRLPRISLTEGVTSHASPDQELMARELASRIQGAISELPTRQRHVLLLRQTTEMTFAEIATATKQPLNTVLSHMRYALEKIRLATREHV
jgi:RNA polymerase sigma factor (sigma-70 family)